MTAHRFLTSRNLRRAWAGAAVLLMAGLTPTAAQFPSPPGQSQKAQANSPFPPPPGQTAAASQANNPFPPAPGQQQSQQPGQQQQRAPSPFPGPGQASLSPGGFGTPSPGGFGTPSSGSFAPSQGGFGVRPGGFSQGPGGSGEVPEAQKICLTFPAIREEVEKGAATIRSAGERKATREEVCPLFKAFAAKEEKLVKFLTTNQKLCGVPPNIIAQVKQNHAKTLQVRNNVCSAAPPGGGGGAAPTLSDALGGPIIADDTSVKSGRGTFDTLTGNALQR